MAALLPLTLDAKHKLVLLKTCVWLITEAESPKHATRFRSEASLEADSGELQHEHVFQLRHLIARLVADPSSLDEVVRQAVACTVTRSEHAVLTKVSRESPELDGWARYSKAGIRVIDTATGRLVEFAT